MILNEAMYIKDTISLDTSPALGTRSPENEAEETDPLSVKLCKSIKMMEIVIQMHSHNSIY